MLLPTKQRTRKRRISTIGCSPFCQLPNKDINIVMGDLNAKVGEDNRNYEQVMGKHGLGEINDNGDRLLACCVYNNLIIGGTIFPHKKIHKATWISPDGQTENQIDHFCISRKFRRSLEDVRVLRGADVGSARHLLIPKLKLKLKKHAYRFTKEKITKISHLKIEEL